MPGLIYKEGNSLKKTTPAPLMGFFDTDYDLLPESTKKTFPCYIQVLTGRGCSFACTFCFNSVCGQKWRGRPMMPEVAGEIDNLVRKYNPKIIYFRDENFFILRTESGNLLNITGSVNIALLGGLTAGPAIAMGII